MSLILSKYWYYPQKNIEIITIVELKRYATTIYIFNIVVYKFYYGQKLCPVSLSSINKSLDIDLDNVILSLILTIFLRIKNNRNFFLYIKKVT